ncbi:MAG: O-acetyl-ADP-ribose deacetylase [Methanosarcina thermophila]|jgi:O-acetyl-ADP-ribose deacetylase (regulator of RNase III)|uniref:O-acetyl-ADP-ribose deacetylase (Regulator of RNase III), contains Macro domain n=3 Tax=Methanosarcina thermophila TaxID=2210 RepID=A0A1I7A7T3_METTE|nr:O-acetyl-ADP-ribose deacetylase [Methanosarcina thermophila]ALK05562.1 MAG: macro domain-containing protein [Methanosarcina sp. 795]AKB11839.1 RNase III inhibitor [Methanosarcina thermophila TM-1]AKB14967.1 RNase III inhibitor [Methanosarcina thermophila CHTI-55]NLU56787.1 O-acetyl-ADP-ribose deacetylase [Methanosarcina thermophila]SFT70991.1 O-acetyl-ADP-ribose deacetylase (regulator of RNase III), contains Macro domain [Methanosarcina thermophila]
MLQISDRIRIIQGDIVKMEVDAIVNAANPTLLGGGGVDGAIHRAAGPGLLEECKGLKGCATGEAKITKGYLLPAKWVIHTVGPVWQGGQKGEDNLLASCYRKSLELAREYEVRTIAFPAISTGAYNFPSERAARIAVSEIKKFIQENQLPEKVFLICFNEETCRHLKAALSESFVV